MKKILLLCLMATTMMFAQTTATSKLNEVSELVTASKQLAVNIKNVQVNTPKVDGVATNSKNAVSTVYGDGKSSVSTVYGDGKSLVQTAYSDGKDMVKYLTPKAEKLLDRVATKLETTSTQLWHILVKQQLVWSWCYLIGMIAALFAWSHFYYRIRKGKEDTNSAGQWREVNVWLCVITFILSSVLSIFSFQHLIPMMTGFINPEFGALQNIVEVAKTLK